MASASGIFLDEGRRDGMIPQVRAHIPALDGLRGLAILMVMFMHFTASCGESAILASSLPLKGLFVKLLLSGGTGVDLFFVLSGFLITGILLDAKDAPRFFRNFYMRRTLRI